MNTLCGTTTMCYPCESRLPALKVPTVPSRPVPTGPQYFTFDPLPEVKKSPAHRNLSKTNRIKKKSRRVLYPRVVKRYYPTEEPNYTKRLLFILLTIIFFQVYSAEEDFPLMEASLSAEENISGCSTEVKESPGEILLLQQPITSALSLEITEAANATGWNWGDEEASASAVDITQFLEQSPAAF
ncbi:radiation-inducible immediate-early gene IEX-1 [Rhineura floridana]|uniref:radiation-inducible immediate-early gene IEX-1 n=1 Tax=Rhineura floridana TaxID=261503 RepID=UPI002AC7FF75|nr:radiation-inducible immediate-early gene IEX-1 [Rhineura floridana]